MAAQREQVPVTSRAQWREWLAEHAADVDGCWLVTTSRADVPYEGLVEEALCVGWVDGQARRLDDGRHAQLYTPRRAGSGWAATNKQRVARLEAAGLMQPGGRSVVDRAKADGSWSLLDTAEALEEPPDLLAALEARPPARAQWDGFPPSARKLMLTWLVTARRPDTRAARVAAVADSASRGERARS